MSTTEGKMNPQERTVEIRRLRRILKTIAENSTAGRLKSAEPRLYVVTDYAYEEGSSQAGDDVIEELRKYIPRGRRDD